MKYTPTRLLLAVCCFIAACHQTVQAQVAMSANGGTYTQNFDSLTGTTWTDNTTLAGWYASKTKPTGATNVTAMVQGNGSSNGGGLYSFGVAGVGLATDRALGSVASGTPGNFAYGIRFVNDTANTVSNIVVSYTGEQWRNGGNVNINKLVFTYRVDSAGIATADAVSNLVWTPFPALDFASVINVASAATLDGNDPANRTVVTNITLTGVTVPASSEIFLRWFDVDDTGSDHGLALDDLTVSFGSATNSGGGGGGFVRVETAANGSGTVVPAQSLASGSSVTVYAVQRDATSNYIGNVAASSWTLIKNGGVVNGDLVLAGDLKSAVFTGHVAGTASIHAGSTTLSSVDSGTITVTAGTPTMVRVETLANGSGTVVPTQNIFPAHTVTGYAIRRDVYSNFVDNAAATWSLAAKTGNVLDSDLTAAGDGKSATFTGNDLGTTTLHAAISGLSSVDSALISVVTAPRAAVVISQVYGGGGNSGSQYANDFVELFNRTPNPVDITGWSVQYGSSAGALGGTASFQVAITNSTIIAPYHYYLIEMGPGANATTALPTPDLINTNIAVSSSAGKIALANTTNALGTVTVLPDSRIVDLVAFGGGSPAEGSSAGTTDNTHGVARISNGCIDTDNNSVDFVLQNPNPRNSSITGDACPTNTPPILSTIPNQAPTAGVALGPIPFTVSDPENASSSIAITFSSSNPTLLPTNNITLGGSGAARNLTLTTVAGQSGAATITVTATDPVGLATSTNFGVFVNFAGPPLGIIFSENFDSYDDGRQLALGAAIGSPWQTHSGSALTMIVSNHMAQVSLPLTNSEDINASVANAPVTALSGAVVYLGFTINQSALPTGAGEYFMHLKDASATNFFCRIYATPTNAASGKYRLGLANRASGAPNVVFPADLDLNTTYVVVAQYNVGLGTSTLWVNPTTPTSTNVTATDTTLQTDMTAIALRESGNTGSPSIAGSQAIDNIVISSSFYDVIPPVPPTLKAAHVGNNVVISWPTNFPAYTLEKSSTLTSNSWVTVTPAPATNGDSLVVTNALTGTNVFYRLQGQ